MGDSVKKRVDVLLVELGFVKSRTLSQKLIESGSVQYKGRTIKESNEKLPVTMDLKTEITVSKSPLTKYVSRGGLKLEGALKKLKLSVKDFEVLDIGLSTGGFADCLIQSGAKHVIGIDVGHGQLHESLKNHPQMTAHEGVNARSFEFNKTFDLIVIDVSFISLTQVLESAKKHLKPSAPILALVKPQFEVGPKNLNPKGIVKNESLYDDVEKKIRESAQKLKLSVKSYFPCDVIGGDGNKEFFAFFS